MTRSEIELQEGAVPAPRLQRLLHRVRKVVARASVGQLQDARTRERCSSLRKRSVSASRDQSTSTISRPACSRMACRRAAVPALSRMTCRSAWELDIEAQRGMIVDAARRSSKCHMRAFARPARLLGTYVRSMTAHPRWRSCGRLCVPSATCGWLWSMARWPAARTPRNPIWMCWSRLPRIVPTRLSSSPCVWKARWVVGWTWRVWGGVGNGSAFAPASPPAWDRTAGRLSWDAAPARQRSGLVFYNGK